MVEPQLDINAINALMVGIPTIHQGPPRPAIETKKRGPGRPRRWKNPKSMEAKFEAETFAEMKEWLKAGESQTDLMNEAVRREIARRKAENESS